MTRILASFPGRNQLSERLPHAWQVQYPGCLPTMMLDLTHIRVFANYLRHTEIKFDLVSAVDELAGQVRMEFDFEREARVMDAIASHLQVPTSHPQPRGLCHDTPCPAPAYLGPQQQLNRWGGTVFVGAYGHSCQAVRGGHWRHVKAACPVALHLRDA